MYRGKCKKCGFTYIYYGKQKHPFVCERCSGVTLKKARIELKAIKREKREQGFKD